MAYYLPEGSKLFMSTGLDSAKAVSVASNATPSALLTAVGHGYVDGDFALFNSGWEDADATIWKMDQQTVDTTLAVGLDSSDTTWFPAGSGTGSLQRVSGWLELTQWLDIQMTGGDGKDVTVSPISRRNDIVMPAGFNAASITLTFGHDINLASQQALITASRGLQKRAFKAVIAGGMVGTFYGNVSFNEMPQIRKGSVLTVTARVNVLGRFISY